MFESAFREAGLPLAILTDNGPPKAETGKPVAGNRIALSSALARQWIELEETDDGIWSVHFCKEPVARFDERTQQLQR